MILLWYFYVGWLLCEFCILMTIFLKSFGAPGLGVLVGAGLSTARNGVKTGSRRYCSPNAYGYTKGCRLWPTHTNTSQWIFSHWLRMQIYRNSMKYPISCFPKNTIYISCEFSMFLSITFLEGRSDFTWMFIPLCTWCRKWPHLHPSHKWIQMGYPGIVGLTNYGSWPVCDCSSWWLPVCSMSIET